jgi:hypothetical protein
MSLHLETTLAGYARAAVDLKIRMAEFTESVRGQSYLRHFAESLLDAAPAGPDQTDPEPPPAAGADAGFDGKLADALERMTSLPWRHGEPYVLAPAMTAVVAAAADALDLTGDVLTSEVAPCDFGVVFLPQPIYLRNLLGRVAGVGAITWAKYSSSADGSASWAVCGWADRSDPHDPTAARTRTQLAGAPQLAAQLGPYLLTQFGILPIGTPVDGRGQPPLADGADRDWEPAPDGRYCIADTRQIPAVASLAYAFWRIQAQPLASVARPPLDRPARRRAVRASIVHDTRIVMLRRTSPEGPEPDGEAKWHYRVRFVVRGHWRHLTDRDGNPYRIWINAHIKGPDGAPLLGGEKVNILAR